MGTVSFNAAETATSQVDAGEPWEGGRDYKAGEVFTHNVTQTTAVDVNGDSIEQGYGLFIYQADRTANGTATLPEILLWEPVGGSQGGISADVGQRLTIGSDSLPLLVPEPPSILASLTEAQVLSGGNTYLANNTAEIIVTLAPAMLIGEKIVIEDYLDNTLTNAVVLGDVTDTFTRAIDPNAPGDTGVSNGPMTVDSGKGEYHITKTAANEYLWRAAI